MKKVRVKKNVQDEKIIKMRKKIFKYFFVFVRYFCKNMQCMYNKSRIN